AHTPIILVTAMDREADKVRGLESGADDYIVKPFSLAELGARIRALVRRSAGHWSQHVIRVGDVEIDLDGRFLKRNGEIVGLTRTEWRLLEYLAASPGKVLLDAEMLS